MGSGRAIENTPDEIQRPESSFLFDCIFNFLILELIDFIKIIYTSSHIWIFKKTADNKQQRVHTQQNTKTPAQAHSREPSTTTEKYKEFQIM
jgi:hypothetical protein